MVLKSTLDISSLTIRRVSGQAVFGIKGLIVSVYDDRRPHFEGSWREITLAQHDHWSQGLSQDLETGCLKLAVVKFLGVQIFRGYHNILRFQP